MNLQLLVWNNMKSQRKRPCNTMVATKLNLMELPMEILFDILKRVPAKSVCHIRCVCKILLSIVDSPSFVTLHSHFLLNPDSHVPPAPPQLILRYLQPLYCCPTSNQIPTLHSLHYDHSNAQGAQLNARDILQSSNPSKYSLYFVFCNLFCIKNRRDHALSFLINPLQGEVLRLPPSQKVCGPYSTVDFVWTGMGFDSITNTYKILRVTEILISKYPTTVEVCFVSQVLVLGTSEWRQIPSTPPVQGLLHCSQNICAYGDTHWFVNYTREGIQGKIHILSFDFKKEEFFWIPNPYILPDPTWQLHLINFRGSMAIVDASSGMNIEIWVMKDYNKKQWMLDYSINIHMLELDPQFEFIGAVCCEWEHGILFIDEPATITLFLDLRQPVVTRNLFKRPNKDCDLVSERIMSLNGSLFSLKNYANLVQAEEPATYSNWTEGEASGNNFFYLKYRGFRF
ncbi:F-box protein At5g65850-like [Rosa rugosa]|uniref:F-box protein At5g65850-like n=1 Tax=Rosa rugosa TaxID=74645 RepID=UPI002B4140F2|nr:F-box protein At5g65850-like [Rosa rugosa]